MALAQHERGLEVSQKTVSVSRELLVTEDVCSNRHPLKTQVRHTKSLDVRALRSFAHAECQPIHGECLGAIRVADLGAVLELRGDI
jgi:hypothetical protein